MRVAPQPAHADAPSEAPQLAQKRPLAGCEQRGQVVVPDWDAGPLMGEDMLKR